MTPREVPLCVHCDLRRSFNATLLYCWDCWVDAETVANLNRDLTAVVP